MFNTSVSGCLCQLTADSVPVKKSLLCVAAKACCGFQSPDTG